MEVTGLNIKNIRNLNKIRIYATKNITKEKPSATEKSNANGSSSTTSTPVKEDDEIIQKGVFSFSAYTTQPVGSFQTQINTSSVPKSVAKFLSGSFVGGLLNNSLATALSQSGGTGGYSTSMNYPYKYSFSGTNTFQKTIQCFLQVENDFYDDIVKPLWKLLNFLLPKESNSVGEKLNIRTVNANRNKKQEESARKSTGAQFLEAGFDLADKAWDVFVQYADDEKNPITFFTIPEQLDLDTNITVYIGNHIKIKNVIISSITLDIPNVLTYEDGLFDRVNITLQLTGTRDMSLDSYSWINELKYSNEYDRRNMNNFDKLESKKASLNSYFDTGASLKAQKKV